MFWVYLLQCRDTSYYVGHTDDLDVRLTQHREKAIASCYTRSRLPVELVYTQMFYTREEALAAEMQIKRWSRKKKEALARKDWESLSRYASRRKKD